MVVLPHRPELISKIKTINQHKIKTMLNSTDFHNFIAEASKLEHRTVHLDAAIAHAREVATRLSDHGKTLAQQAAEAESLITGSGPALEHKIADLEKIKQAAAAFAPEQ